MPRIEPDPETPHGPSVSSGPIAEAFDFAHISLTLEHNPHLGFYESIDQWLESQPEGGPTWIGPDEHARALESGSLWVLQWYPTTPVGFHLMMAADLDRLIQAVRAAAAEEGCR